MKVKIIDLVTKGNFAAVTDEIGNSRKIDLSNIPLNDQQIAGLAHFLKNNSNIYSVNLTNCNISSESAKVLADMLEDNHKITIFSNNIRDKAVKSKITELLLRNNSERNNKITEELKKTVEALVQAEEDKADLQQEINRAQNEAENEKDNFEVDKNKLEQELNLTRNEAEKLKLKAENLQTQILTLTAEKENLEEAKTNLQRLYEEKIASSDETIRTLTIDRNSVENQLTKRDECLHLQLKKCEDLEVNYSRIENDFKALAQDLEQKNIEYKTSLQEYQAIIGNRDSLLAHVIEEGEKNLACYQALTKSLNQKEIELSNALELLKFSKSGISHMQQEEPPAKIEEDPSDYVDYTIQPLGNVCEIL